MLIHHCLLAVAALAASVSSQSDDCVCSVGPSGTDVVADCNDSGIGDQLPACLPSNVTILWLSGNNLTQLTSETLAALPDLVRAELYMNQIASVAADTFINNPAIIQVFLNINNLTELLPGTFAFTPLLNSLYLDNNRLSQLEGSIFYNNTELAYLSAENNQLTSLERSTFSEVPSLRYLLLCDNRLEYLAADTFADVPRLAELHLCNNRLSQLPAALFTPLSELTILYMGYNRITDLPLDAFRNGSTLMEYAFVEGNQLQTLDGELLSQWPRLLDMRLYDNPWACNCSLQPAVQSLAGLWAGVPSGQCAQPEDLRGRPLGDAVLGLCCDDACTTVAPDSTTGWVSTTGAEPAAVMPAPPVPPSPRRARHASLSSNVF